MKWTAHDLRRYAEAKEYIDTLLIPFVPIHFSDDQTFIKNAFEREILTILLHQLEKELSGRTLLLPEYNYLHEAKKEDEIERIKTWISQFQKQPFEHIFYFTYDVTWKKYEQSLEGALIWLPSQPEKDLHSEEIASYINHQIKQVSELIRTFWTS